MKNIITSQLKKDIHGLSLRKRVALFWKKFGSLIVIFSLMYFLYFIVGFITSLDKEIAAAILAGMFTIIVSVISVLVSKHVERGREIDREIREKKVPKYDDIIRFLFGSIFAPDNLKEKRDDLEISRKVREFSVDALIWGSDDVLREWINFSRRIKQGNARPLSDPATLLARGIMPLGELLLAIRKDIGHSNKDISSIYIMHLFINDLDETIDKIVAKKDKDTSN